MGSPEPMKVTLLLHRVAGAQPSAKLLQATAGYHVHQRRR